MTYLAVLLAAVCFAAFAMCINEGLWSNTITLLCIILAGLMGVFVGVPLGNWAVEQAEADAATTWYYVFGGMWIVFLISAIVFRVLTDKASRTRMRFIPLLDRIAGPLMAVYVAVMLTSFASYTLLRAPIASGEWKIEDASENVVLVFKYANAPFWNVVTSFAGGEGIESPLLK
jgi:uncharacterized membrane protein required for colicin V production